MKRTLACLTVALACAALPASAGAHAILTLDGGVLLFNSPDSVSLDQVVVSQTADAVELEDRTVSGGIDPGPCVPVSEYIVDCPKSSVSSLTVDVGPHNDRFEMLVPLPVTVYGGPDQDELIGGPLADVIDGGTGWDKLTGGDGDDTLTGREGEDALAGGSGNDVLVGSEEPDSFDGGPGDDDIRSRDGVPETVTCGDGNDRVTADPTDITGLDCESVDRALPGSDPPPEEVAPVASVSGRKTQKVSRAKRLSVRAASNKAGKVTAYTTVLVNNLRYRLPAVTKSVTAGGPVSLVPRISRSVMRQVKSAWKSRRRVTATVRVQAVDGFGNRSEGRQLRVRLIP
jgi:Ca2+-binding RTX toxin-like protein